MKRKSGFTLIELVIVMVILTLLVGLSASYSFIMLDTLGFLTRQANLQESAELAFSRISREVRRVRNDQSVVTAGLTQFSFFDVSNAQITYRLTGGALVRDYDSDGAGPVLPVTDELADKVTGFFTTYYDNAGAIIGSPTVSPLRTNIRRIKFEILIADSPHAITDLTVIRPRNLRHESYMFF